MPWPFEIRGAVVADEDQLLDVARHLNTVNLPADRDEIRGILEQSQARFSGAFKDLRRR
jgi:arginine N-succinyltransferase